MLLSYLGPVSCSFQSLVPSGCNDGGRCSSWGLGSGHPFCLHPEFPQGSPSGVGVWGSLIAATSFVYWYGRKHFFIHRSNIRDLRDNTKHADLHIIGVPEGEDREKGIKDVFEEIMGENFTNLKEETDIQVQEKQRVPNKMDSNRSTPRHIIIKMAKVKERILKAAREKQSQVQGNLHKAISWFLSRNFAGQKGVAWCIQNSWKGNT